MARSDHSLTFRIVLIVVLTVALTGAIGAFFLTAHLTRDQHRHFSERGQTLSLLLARLVAEGIAEERLDLINRASYIMEERDVIRVSVYTEFWDRIETYPPAEIRLPTDPRPPHVAAAARFFAEDPAASFFNLADPNEPIHRFLARVNYQPFSDGPIMAAGFVSLHFSTAGLDHDRAEMLHLHLAQALLYALVIITLLVALLHQQVIAPLRRLHGTMSRFAQGTLPERLPPLPAHEIGELGHRFLEMARTVDEKKVFLDAILKSAPYGIVATDQDLRVTYVNPAITAIFGLPADQALGRRVDEVHLRHRVDRQRLDDTLAIVRQNGSHAFQLQWPHGDDGRPRQLEATVLAVTDTHGTRRGYMLMLNDITRRIRFQEALQRSNQELEQFAYVASHDLQEPLRVITGFVQLLEKKQAERLDEKGCEYMRHIVDAAERMKGLINDLLAYSRLSTRAQPPVAHDLNESLALAQANIALLIEEQGVEIKSRPLPTVLAEPGQMTQLWQNLLTNAIRYRHPQRPPRIMISAERRRGKWRMVVADNGIGIKPQYFERIFKIFQRLHSREEYPGTGIGLALCRKIVERHRGRIWVESAGEGMGSAFYFTLPELSAAPTGPDDPQHP